MSSVPLPSWNKGATKSAIVDFVARVTNEGGADFVPPAGRIATFDNDGTLWCEQPMQVQVFFALDRLDKMAVKDPTLRERQPYKAFLERDMKTIVSLGKQGVFEIALRPCRDDRGGSMASPVRGCPRRNNRSCSCCSRNAYEPQLNGLSAG